MVYYCFTNIIHTHIHTHIHTYIPTYIHTYTHTYIHTYKYIYIADHASEIDARADTVGLSANVEFLDMFLECVIT